MFRTILATTFLFNYLGAFSQEGKNGFGIQLGIARPTEIQFIGSSGVQGRSLDLGFSYYRRLSGKLKIESGMVWHENRGSTHSSPPNSLQINFDKRFVYLPMFLRWNPTRHVFFQCGLLADLDLRKETALNSQTGLGLGTGFGFETPLSKKLVLQINPFLNFHSLWWSTVDFNPFDLGIKIGIRTN